ncbi:MAG: SDR family oxidoreductase, partial [Clostridia bacterium]|nr:SDR family oxidoreductase [Clostridia bacterium]
NDEAAKTTVSEINALGVKALAVKGDIAVEKTAQAIIDVAVNEFESVDVLVNNAGITDDSLLVRMGLESFEKVVNTNLTGAFNALKCAAKLMIKQKSGRIINISSVVGEAGNAGQSNYAASKAGLIGLTKSAAKELAPRGITVNAVAPGYIDTDMTAALSEEIKAEALKNIPLKRYGTPDDVAQAVCFLVESSYITGQVINVCGGMLI